ncbi:MAG TPA: HEAT repeat domain-containing protein [Tepidisphaeraceae bacterium]
MRTNSKLARRCLAVVLAAAGPFVMGAGKDESKPLDEPTILKGIKGPKDFDVTVFAAPPNVMYPTAVSATPTGELYVAIDEDGSLGKDPGKGRVVKCVDSDGDGKADRFTVFAKMEHPRGVYFDTSTDTLYVLHPPFITAFQDTNGDGVADKQEVLASGIANEKVQGQRGADHTTNGFRVGIDGWMYIAQGDFGSVKATAKRDGSTYVRHGGGVSRMRLDGTGLEMYSTGQRNICDVAVDPLMNVFTRDNTNDGDGWDVRLSYIVPSGYYGYPSKFKHFQDEMIQPLADYGGGSPVGSLFLDEPNYPGDLGHSLYTVEWGRGGVFRHPLEQNGANFKAKQEEFMVVPRGIDMDADALGHLYVASWVNGGFSYSGPNVGYVVRVTPKNHQPATFPDLKKLSDDQLVQEMASPSAVTRQFAQREVLRRGKSNAAAFGPALAKLAGSQESLPARVAALFTLKQLEGDKANEAIVGMMKQEEMREFALRALCDVKNDPAVPVGPFVESLSDPNPRVRLIAAWGLGRLNKTEAAGQLMPLVADSDPLVSHVAITALVSLHASQAALKALDPSTPTLVSGAIRVLQELHETQVVDALLDKLKTTQDTGLRGQIYKGLCRLNYREADWDGGWWGTRPDTAGPYFKTAEWEGTAKIQSVLKAALTSENPEVVKELAVNLQKNKVDFPELTATIQRLAAQDPSFKSVLVDLVANRPNLTDESVKILVGVATSEKEPAELRAKSIRALQKNANRNNTLAPAITALASIVDSKDKELTNVFNDFVRDGRLSQQVYNLSNLAQGASATPAKREVVYTILVNLSNNKLLQKDRRVQESLAKALDPVWSKPPLAASLLNAIARTKSEQFADRVKTAMASPNPQVASAAKLAAERLGLTGSGNVAESNSASAALIEKLKYADVVAVATKAKGDAKAGQELFTKLGCVQCHTTSPEDPPKGPFLGGIATRYSPAELCESILKPSAKISQGFETQWFKTRDDDDYEGFVTRESGDDLDVRNILGVTSTLKKSEIKERGKRETSIMPEGLVAKLTPQDLASILAFLESTKGK